MIIVNTKLKSLSRNVETIKNRNSRPQMYNIWEKTHTTAWS